MDEKQQAFQDFERDGWNEVAPTYAKIAGGATAGAADVLLDAVGAGEGSVVVDLACGPGHGLTKALARGATAIGVDISASMVEIASNAVPGAVVHRGAGEALPLDDNSADGLISAFGLPHFADHGAVFGEARRVLRDGGRLAMATWLPPDRNPFFGLAMGAIAQAGDLGVGATLPPGEDMFAYADAGRAEVALTAVGFTEVELTEHEAAFNARNAPASMETFYTGGSVRTRALFSGQTEQQRADILATVSEMLEAYRHDDGYSVPMTYAVITATAA